MKVEIDKKSGFCFGVINAIRAAENELNVAESLYCLGDIVHNGKEVELLEKMGLKSISKEEYFNLLKINNLSNRKITDNYLKEFNLLKIKTKIFGSKCTL